MIATRSALIASAMVLTSTLQVTSQSSNENNWAECRNTNSCKNEYVHLMTQETLKANGRMCNGMHLIQRRINSKAAIEEFILAEIEANAKEYGVLDWDCMIREFESLGHNATAKFYPDGSSDGADAVRFMLDRSGSLLATLMSMGPGNSNGVFVATFRLKSPSEVAVIRRGGKPEWLKLELRQNP